jgi:hypothetical protein
MQLARTKKRKGETHDGLGVCRGAGEGRVRTSFRVKKVESGAQSAGRGNVLVKRVAVGSAPTDRGSAGLVRERHERPCVRGSLTLPGNLHCVSTCCDGLSRSSLKSAPSEWLVGEAGLPTGLDGASGACSVTPPPAAPPPSPPLLAPRSAGLSCGTTPR